VCLLEADLIADAPVVLDFFAADQLIPINLANPNRYPE
jgi:hypothetical protein